MWCHCAPVIKLITLPTPSPSAHLRHHDTSSGLLIAAAENTENTVTGAGAAILDTTRPGSALQGRLAQPSPADPIIVFLLQFIAGSFTMPSVQ